MTKVNERNRTTKESTKEIILEGKNVSIGYRNKKQDSVIHQGMNFCLYQGELTCLLGANGAGKSTLLRTLSAIQPSLSGDIFLLNKSLDTYTERERSRTIGVVLTERTQTGGLTVYELISLGRQPHTGFFGRLNAVDKDSIQHAIEAVGISHLTHKYMAELSDGERQKAFIAKALVQECPLILLDEPTAYLDIVSRIEIMNLLSKLAKEEHRAILLSTHDIDQALIMADRLWLLHPQKGIHCGVPEDLILSHCLEELFESPNICFNMVHGGFTPHTSCNRCILLETSDMTLRHWSENALQRLGYKCIAKEDINNFSPDTFQGQLHIISAKEIILNYKNKKQTFHSFEELIRELELD